MELYANVVPSIIALRNEKGSYNKYGFISSPDIIIALRNEKGSYNEGLMILPYDVIIVLRNITLVLLNVIF